jgi:hypothetical protein
VRTKLSLADGDKVLCVCIRLTAPAGQQKTQRSSRGESVASQPGPAGLLFTSSYLPLHHVANNRGGERRERERRPGLAQVCSIPNDDDDSDVYYI